MVGSSGMTHDVRADSRVDRQREADAMLRWTLDRSELDA
jgi:hypothetical protein